MPLLRSRQPKQSAKLRLKRVVSVHVGELGESLRQFVRLGLGEAVVGGVEVVINSVGVGAVLNGNKVVVGGGEVCDACVVV